MNGVILIISLRRTNLTDLSDRRTRVVVADNINELNRDNLFALIVVSSRCLDDLGSIPVLIIRNFITRVYYTATNE